MTSKALQLLDRAQSALWPDLAAFAGAGPRGGEHHWLRWLENATPADEARAVAALAAFSTTFLTRAEVQPKGETMSTTHFAAGPVSTDPAEALRRRAEAAGWPELLSGLNSQSAWLLALAQPTRHSELTAALDRNDRNLGHAAEDTSRRRSELLAQGRIPEWEMTVAERGERAYAEGIKAQDAAFVKRYEAERPKRIEELLQRIANALETRR